MPKERERLTNSSSLQGTDVTADTFEAVRTVFVELFCAPKSSMENPSLRVSGHGSSTNRTFIVEDCAEDDFGRWATDEVTGEQSYIGQKRTLLGGPKERKARKACQNIMMAFRRVVLMEIVLPPWTAPFHNQHKSQHVRCELRGVQCALR